MAPSVMRSEGATVAFLPKTETGTMQGATVATLNRKKSRRFMERFLWK
jgi:hypothetical protein